MKNPIRNETSLILVVAVILSAIAIPVLSGFLEPSQPPAVAAVQIGDPRDRDDGAAAPEPRTRDTRRAPARPDRPTPSSKRERPASSSPTTPASSARADDLADDDGEAD